MYEHLVKVLDAYEYDAANEKMSEAIKKQINKAIIKFRLFTQMTQEEEKFASYWSTIKEYSDKYDFT